MHFTLRNLRAFHLAIIASSAFLGNYSLAQTNMCPNNHSGRLSIDDCIGYVDCMDGIEIDRKTCTDDTLYSANTLNCEPEDAVIECNGHPLLASPTTGIPVIIDDGGMFRTSSTQPQVVHDGPDAVAVWSTTAAGGTTDTTSSPHIVFDGPDAVAPLSTTVPARSATTATAVIDGPDATAFWTTTEATEHFSTQATSPEYTPDRSKSICVPVENRKQRRLRSVWDGVYPSKEACCAVYSFNRNHYNSCINN